MKYEYARPTIQIRNWLVNVKDIEKINSLFKERFSILNVPISIETTSGNNRKYDSYEEMLIDLEKLVADKESVEKIVISYRSSDTQNYNHFKQMWIDLNFGKYGGANFHIIAGDTDGSFKDWVSGTYEEMNKLSKIFEIQDTFIIEKIKKNFLTTVVFDYDGSINESIKAEILKQKETIPTNSTHVLSGNVRKNWYEKPIGQIVIGLFVLIVGTIILKIVGII